MSSSGEREGKTCLPLVKRTQRRLHCVPRWGCTWPAVSPGRSAPSPGEDGVVNSGHVRRRWCDRQTQMVSTYDSTGHGQLPIYGLRV